MKRLLFILGPFLSFVTGVAQGCMCAEHTPLCQGYWDATAVFAGTVMHLTSVAVEHKLLVHFVIEKNYKDNLGAEVNLSSGLTDCDYSFRLGERYLVYAYRDQETKEIRTSICTLTKPLAEAKQDIEYIGSLSAEPAGTRLFGSVLDYTRAKAGTPASTERLAGADIRLKGPEGVKHVVSDGQGKYEWKGLPAGKYQIAATLANYVSPSTRNVELDLPGRGCFPFNLLLQSNGQIDGRVFDAHGTPLPNLQVDLADAEGNGLAELRAETDSEGIYHFGGVRPGDFFIGVNLSDPPSLKNPYVRTYLPNAPKRDSAAIVHLPKAGKLNGQDIYLSRRTEPREVQGVILWPDGRPASDANIALAYPDYPWRTDSRPGPDSAGKFSVQVLTNLRTVLWIQARDPAGVWVNAGQVELPLEGPIKPLTLVLKP